VKIFTVCAWFEQGKEKKKPQFTQVFMCIPVSPGRSRLITSYPRNASVWLDKIIPRWYHHIGVNAVLDSDIYLLHVEVTIFSARAQEP
jgi:hypothetical protein